MDSYKGMDKDIQGRAYLDDKFQKMDNVCTSRDRIKSEAGMFGDNPAYKPVREGQVLPATSFLLVIEGDIDTPFSLMPSFYSLSPHLQQ